MAVEGEGGGVGGLLGTAPNAIFLIAARADSMSARCQFGIKTQKQAAPSGAFFLSKRRNRQFKFIHPTHLVSGIAKSALHRSFGLFGGVESHEGSEPSLFARL